MRRAILSLVAVLICHSPAYAQGLLVPAETKLRPLVMSSHHVKVTLEDQVAVTTVEQVFHNNIDLDLEATYVFPVPKGASVRKFSMWVNGKEEKGELVEADKARQIYNDIVRRTLDPGILEHIGANLLRVRVFPVPRFGDQKISLSFTSVAPMEGGVVGYTYPLRIETNSAKANANFSLEVNLKSQHPIHNIYSPTHSISSARPNDKEATVRVTKDQALANKDFQLFYTSAAGDVGLTSLLHRPTSDAGYFLMLISPRYELSHSQQVARDMVFVLDTSGSMQGQRIEQARKALKFCVDRLSDKDRFAILHFATTVTKYDNALKPADTANIQAAGKWVETLQATGGTDINGALLAALEMRSGDASRPFTVVFFTDGQPTVGETRPETILKNVLAKNSANTRIFAFGVGDDVNAALLDQLAEHTRAVTTYVREREDIESKVGGLYAKISSPVLTDLKLEVGEGVKLSQVYPPELPDLFHGTQLVVLGRYTGQGKAEVKLTGKVGKEARSFVYQHDFIENSSEDKSFVEDLWARRKVGFLLDQIRINGENKELKDEVITLAKRYGITTPYTSYLVVPDSMPKGGGSGAAKSPPVLGKGGAGGKKGGKAGKVDDFAKKFAKEEKKAEESRKDIATQALKDAAAAGDKKAIEQLAQQSTFAKAKDAITLNELSGIQRGTLGVDLALQVDMLRNQQQMAAGAVQRVGARNLVDIGGVWIDDGFNAKMQTVTIKAQSEAYFRLLEKQPAMRDLLRLGNHLVYVTPSGDALIIDAEHGAEKMDDAAIDRLFVAPKKK